MEKVTLDKFINKYNLGGAAEQVLWKSAKGKLSTNFISDDKNVLGKVTLSDSPFDDVELGVIDTAQLKSFLGILDDEIKLKVNKTTNRPVSVLFTDKIGTKVTYMLSEPSVIPAVPDLKNEPPYDLKLHLDPTFMNTFVRAKNAMGDQAETFTVTSDGSKAQVILGYSRVNTNRVTLDVVAKPNDVLTHISFSAKYFRDILMANKEAKEGTIEISSKGLAHATFTLDEFSVDYYLVQIKTVD